jgi:HEPN domain-containing protein
MCAEVEIARQWVAKASNDLLNADNNLSSEQIPYDTVCFHCQQAAEKLLKAYLACIGQSPPVTHDLLLLLESVLPSSPEAEALRDVLALLIPYAVEIRYPDDWFTPSAEDTQEAREAAEAVLNWLQESKPVLFEGYESGNDSSA